MKISKKIVLLGHFGVGKSSLIRRFVEDTFTDSYKVTIGVHILKKEVKFIEDGKDVNLIIWDLEGYDDIKKTRQSYLLGTHGIIYVFDITRPATYKDLKESLDYLKDKFSDVPVKVAANKSDLVTKKYIKAHMDSYGVRPDYFTSAKSGDKVEELFVQLAKEFLDR
ncbi:Rab family GTPase [Sungkyunkwania multivorans]|uniref:Rab family GTPase n=1 Tax=Sungkyunkwania multivorans TaxID=1173618 RepID=A0ABW3CTP5_9FLAO